MIHPARFIFSGICFTAVIALFLTWGFPDRSARFGVNPAAAKTDRSGVYELAKARILTRVLGHVRTHYVDPKRVDVRKMAGAAIRAVQEQVPDVMVQIIEDKKKRPRALVVAVAEKQKTFQLGQVNDLFQLNWKLMDIFRFLEAHLPPSVDLEAVEYTAINGILRTLDPHSLVLTPRMYREMQVGTKGRFGGLGIVISVREGMLTVMSVMRDTPADRAGLKSGDKIVQIGEESTVNMPLSDAVTRLRGKPGTSVLIWVRRKGLRQLKSFTITRQIIRIRSVEHRKLPGKVGYIKIRNFQRNTFSDLQKALIDLTPKSGSIAGLILDLRENPGGLLQQAIEVSDRFLDRGTIVTTIKESSRSREAKHATAKGALTKVPMVVLINRGSASASEIVAGALKHNDRAMIVGSRSYGKGSVQVVYSLDEAALKLTVAQYLTPKDISIQSVGIIPDIAIVRMKVNKKTMDLVSDERRARGESTLKSHLKGAKSHQSRASIHLKLLEEEPAKGAKKEDPLVSLARRIVLAAPAPNRKQALVQSAGLLAQVQRDENVRVAKRLKKLGIPWEVGPNPKRLSLSLRLRLKDMKPGERPRAGQKIVLEASLTNRGKRPIFQALGVLRSAIHAIDGAEMVFGRVDPGQTRRWTFSTKLPKSLPLIGDLTQLDLRVGARKVKQVKARLPMVVQARKRPVFSNIIQIHDPPGKKGGNGNGLIQRGETIRLHVLVRNDGTGVADDVLAIIRNASGEHVFIKKGRQKLGKIRAGETARAVFEIEIRKPLKLRLIQLKLSVIDQTTRTLAMDDLDFQVFPREFEAAKPETGILKVGAKPIALFAGAHKESGLIATAPPGAELEVIAGTSTFAKVQWIRSLRGRKVNFTGWIRRKDTSSIQSRDPASPVPSLNLRSRAPAITLAPEMVDAIVTAKSTVTLKGIVNFGKQPTAGRRDVYIFRGRDKVYFRSYRSGVEAQSFEASIPLKTGSNRLLIVARSGKTHVTRVVLRVARRKGGK